MQDNINNNNNNNININNININNNKFECQINEYLNHQADTNINSKRVGYETVISSLTHFREQELNQNDINLYDPKLIHLNHHDQSNLIQQPTKLINQGEENKSNDHYNMQNNGGVTFRNITLEQQQQNQQQHLNEAPKLLKEKISQTDSNKKYNNTNNNKMNRGKTINSQNSFGSNKGLSLDQQFIAKLLKREDERKSQWYRPIIIFFIFLGFQFLNPFILIIQLAGKGSNQIKKYWKQQSCKKIMVIRFFQGYFLFSSVVLWMGCVNYLYIKIVQPMNNEEEDLITSEYNKIFIYYIVVSIGFAILGTSALKNNFLSISLFSSLAAFEFTSLNKFMKKLYISNYDFMFQFIYFPNEDENKLLQKQKIKVIYCEIYDQVCSQQKQTNHYYSGLDFCEKIINYSKKKNMEIGRMIIAQILVTSIVYIKSFIPGIYRYYSGQSFVIYSQYFTIVPYLCVGNIIGFFSRMINSLRDLNFIYDYNKALSALISYDSYLNLKPKHNINTPSINPVDIRTLKTWSQMRKLLNEFKKLETIPIDRCTLFLFIYLALIFLAVFLDKIFKTVVIISFSSEKYVVPYYSIDVFLISYLFCYRVYFQVKINEQYKIQHKLLQQLKNINLKFFLHRDSFIEKDNIVVLDKDIQWYFYSQLNENYQDVMQKTKIFSETLQNNKNDNQNNDTNNSSNNPDNTNDYANNSNLNANNNNTNNKNNANIMRDQDQRLQDDAYFIKLIQLIEYIQHELEMEILQTPMKFIGLLPSTYGLLYTFMTFFVSFIYLSFYIYYNYQVS